MFEFSREEQDKIVKDFKSGGIKEFPERFTFTGNTLELSRLGLAVFPKNLTFK